MATIIILELSQVQTLGELHDISYMLQQLHADKGVAKGLWAAGVRLLGLGTRLMHSSVIQGSTAHSSNNPGMLYGTPVCTSSGLKHTTQYCMSNSSYRNSLGLKHCNAMHAYKPESQRVSQE